MLVQPPSERQSPSSPSHLGHFNVLLFTYIEQIWEFTSQWIDPTPSIPPKVSPLPISNNHHSILHIYMSLTFSRSFQTGELEFLCHNWDTHSLFVYFCLTIVCHSPSSLSNFHHHLHSRLRFILLSSTIPRPPFLFGPFDKVVLFFSRLQLAKKKISCPVHSLDYGFRQQVQRHADSSLS